MFVLKLFDFFSLSCLLVLKLAGLIGPLMWQYLSDLNWKQFFIHTPIVFEQYMSFVEIFFLLCLIWETIKPNLWISGVRKLSANAHNRASLLKYKNARSVESFFKFKPQYSREKFKFS